MKQESPCNGCEKRNSTCHADCKEYKAWRKAEDERSSGIKKEKDRNNLLNSYAVSAAKNMQTKRNRKKEKQR